MATTTIQVSEELAEELASRKRRGDTYEHVIRRLLEGRDRGRETRQEAADGDSDGVSGGGEGVGLECPKCSYEWQYGGSMDVATCPSCQHKVPVDR